MKVKAAVCNEYKQPLAIEELELDSPGKGEVRVRVAACAICHSDIHGFRGEHGEGKLPGIGGHEVAGYVEELGEGVSYVKVGDPVTVSIVTTGCGQCYFCTIGQPILCQNKRIRLNMPGRYTNKKGERLTQFGGGLAGFVECTTVSEDRLVKIPPDMPIDRAALLSCGVISGFGAVVNKAKVQPFSSVVVMGAGGVGLNAIQGARFSGAHPIIAVDVLDSKLEAAKVFGATHTVNAKKDSNPVNTVREITYGRGADYVFIAVAGIEIKRQGFSMSGQSGMTVNIGHAGKEWMSAFDATEFVGGKIMTGSVMGMTRPRIDIPRLIELYQYGRLKLDELISRRYSLEDINEALEVSATGDVMRNVIMF